MPLYGEYRDLVTQTICIDWANSSHRNIHVDYECDLSGRLPLDDASVDTIVLSCVLEHLPEPIELWREMHRILRATGKVMVCVPFLYPLHEVPHDYFRYTEFALRRFAESTGFVVLSIDPIGGAPEVLANIFCKVLRRVPRIGPPMSVATQIAASALLKTRIGRKASQTTARSYPLHYFMVAQKP